MHCVFLEPLKMESAIVLFGMCSAKQHTLTSLIVPVVGVRSYPEIEARIVPIMPLK